MADEETDQNKPLKPGTHNHAPCMEKAWELFCEGVYSYRAIARGVNRETGCKHDHMWVKRNLEKYSKMVAEVVDNAGIDARAEYIQGLKQDLVAQANIARDQTASPAHRSQARLQMTKIREKLAAARGVTTERKATEHSGDIDLSAVWLEGIGEDGSESADA